MNRQSCIATCLVSHGTPKIQTDAHISEEYNSTVPRKKWRGWEKRRWVNELKIQEEQPCDAFGVAFMHDIYMISMHRNVKCVDMRFGRYQTISSWSFTIYQLYAFTRYSTRMNSSSPIFSVSCEFMLSLHNNKPLMHWMENVLEWWLDCVEQTSVWLQYRFTFTFSSPSCCIYSVCPVFSFICSMNDFIPFDICVTISFELKFYTRNFNAFIEFLWMFAFSWSIHKQKRFGIGACRFISLSIIYHHHQHESFYSPPSKRTLRFNDYIFANKHNICSKWIAPIFTWFFKNVL